MAYVRGGSEVVSYAANGVSDKTYLGTIGHIGNLQYGYCLPGGCDTLSCLLEVIPNYRTAALNPGRVVQVERGGSVIWDGYMLEPSVDTAGWTITANGAGHYGDNFVAIWDGAISSTGVAADWSADVVVNAAIARGMRWTSHGVNNSALYDGSPNDPASMTITDALNQFCTAGSYTWYVNRSNVLNVFPVPGYNGALTPNRILVVTTPQARTLAGYINTIYCRYEITAASSSSSGSGSATYGLGAAVNQASINAYGRQEIYWDISGDGVATQTQADNLSAAALAKYQAASWGGPFAVMPGQLLNMGGQAVDLGQEQAGTVCQLILVDGAYGGEVIPTPPIGFVVGQYDYNDVTLTASVTPFQAVDMSLSGMLGQMSTILTPPSTTGG